MKEKTGSKLEIIWVYEGANQVTKLTLVVDRKDQKANTMAWQRMAHWVKEHNEDIRFYSWMWGELDE